MGVKHYKIQLVCDECRDETAIVEGYGDLIRPVYKEIQFRLTNKGWDSGFCGSTFRCQCKKCFKITNKTLDKRE